MAKRAARRKDFSLMTFLNYGYSVCPFSTHTNWPQFDIYNGDLNAMRKKQKRRAKQVGGLRSFFFLEIHSNTLHDDGGYLRTY